MSIGAELMKKSKLIKGIERLSYQSVAKSLEVIPKLLSANARVIKIITDLRAKHSEDENSDFGIDGLKGIITKMSELGIVEPFKVKSQTIKTAIETSCMLLRIDNIIHKFIQACLF
jgi:T-complex protein 1 subunit gamma